MSLSLECGSTSFCLYFDVLFSNLKHLVLHQDAILVPSVALAATGGERQAGWNLAFCWCDYFDYLIVPLKRYVQSCYAFFRMGLVSFSWIDALFTMFFSRHFSNTKSCHCLGFSSLLVRWRSMCGYCKSKSMILLCAPPFFRLWNHMTPASHSVVWIVINA